jgi:hypothetical protein
MTAIKYVILKENKVPILFNAAIQHCDEANGREVYSAGFVDMYVQDGQLLVRCWGGSTSLGGIPAKPEIDEPLILKTLLSC